MYRSGILAWLSIASIFPTGLLAETSPPTLPKIRPPSLQRKPLPGGEALIANAEYNTGDYGQYVKQSFKSAPGISAPRLNMMKSFTDCDDGSYLFITPRGEVVKDTTAAIYDHSGSLIWKPADGEFHEVYNFQMQEYKGRPYISFWSGDNSGGHGDGYYYMFDQSYNLTRKINAGNGLSADLHSFTILPEGTALLTTYEKVTTDLQGLAIHNPEQPLSFMWDCLFQEVDIETGNVTFEWRASDHFALVESYADYSIATEQEPWDFFHINSVEKDATGNYLVSSRHLRCVSYVSGRTGEVLWKLGGKRNSFKDLSGGDATRFVGQHDAHFDEDGRFVTFFDNRADWYFELEHKSKGRRIEIDTINMTAKVNATYVHPQEIFAFSQGSYQTLPNRNVLLGYGFTGAMTEFDRNGTVLCDAYLQPSSRFSSGDVQSYRNLKFNWTGLPTTKPSVVIENEILYVSWLGSTEVRSWWLQDSTAGEETRWAPATIFDKTGFETQINLDELLLRQYVRVVALDANQEPLRTSEILSIGSLAKVWEDVSEEEAVKDIEETMILEQKWQDMGALVGFAILAIGTAAIVFVVSWRPRFVRRWVVGREKEQGTYIKENKGPKSENMWQRTKAMWPTRQKLASYHMLPQWKEEDGSDVR